jgi:hypothetical protein
VAGCPIGIPVDRHFCYIVQTNCAAVVVESASLTLVFKEDAMLIGIALILVAIALCCVLLFRLSIYALPLFVAFTAASAAYHNGYGIIAALVAAVLAAIATIAITQLVLGLAKSDVARAAIGLVFALPAAFAGYHAVHGIAVATMPASSWQVAVSLIGATVVATASWTQWAAARH